MREIRIGLIGFGTVGKGLAKALLAQKERLLAENRNNLCAVNSCRYCTAELTGGIQWSNTDQRRQRYFFDPKIDIVVELIGGMEPAKTFILKAIENGKHVVTANKALLSVHGREIFQAAAKNNVEVGFEASVGGGIPVIKALKGRTGRQQDKFHKGNHERHRQLYPLPDDRPRHPVSGGA